MFQDRRFIHFEKDSKQKLIEENVNLKQQLQNWQTWWFKIGRFLIEPKKYNELVARYNKLVEMYNTKVEENKKLKEEVESKNNEILQLKEKILSLLKEKLLEKMYRIVKPDKIEPLDTYSDLKLKWLKVLKPPFRCVIIGKSGSGKTTLGHFLLEIFKYQKDLFILGFPKEKIKLLPEYINVVDSFEKIPPNSICLIDEAYIKFGARQSMEKDKNFDLIQTLGLFRQRDISLIFITQSTSLIDKVALSMIDFIIVKEMSKFGIEFERKEFKKLIENANKMLENIAGDRKRFSYLISTDGKVEKIMENDLPSYWNEEISCAYQSGFISGERYGRKITKEEKKKIANQLRQNGYSYKQISKIIGVSKATIINWLKHKK
jgi:energy-coupling factor transporter ATP-binding protein EcfA2